MTTFHSPFTLRQVLLIDAAACLGMGALLSALSGPIAGLTGIPAALSFWAGLILFPVAAYMAAVALWLTGLAAAVWLVILGNLLWVGASLALVLGLIAPNGLGVAFILGQAVFVAAMAWLEHAAARARHPRPQAAT